MLTKICSYTSGAVKMTYNKFINCLLSYGMKFHPFTNFVTLTWGNVIWGYAYYNASDYTHTLRFATPMLKVKEKNLKKEAYSLFDKMLIEETDENAIIAKIEELIPKIKKKTEEFSMNDINKDFV